jgi:hypothetical protein
MKGKNFFTTETKSPLSLSLLEASLVRNINTFLDVDPLDFEYKINDPFDPEMLTRAPFHLASTPIEDDELSYVEQLQMMRLFEENEQLRQALKEISINDKFFSLPNSPFLDEEKAQAFPLESEKIISEVPGFFLHPGAM